MIFCSRRRPVSSPFLSVFFCEVWKIWSIRCESAVNEVNNAVQNGTLPRRAAAPAMRRGVSEKRGRTLALQGPTLFFRGRTLFFRRCAPG